jgi:hypothetical protein
MFLFVLPLSLQVDHREFKFLSSELSTPRLRELRPLPKFDARP